MGRMDGRQWVWLVAAAAGCHLPAMRPAAAPGAEPFAVVTVAIHGST